MTEKTNTDIVLIRGLVREARHWGDFTGILKQLNPNANIQTPDIPGNGYLYDVSSPNTIAAMTEVVRQQIPIRNKLNLIAISMGGMIAIDWMCHYPGEINSAVLINTSARPISPFYQRLRWHIYPEIIRILLRSKTSQEQLILALTSNKHHQNKDILNEWLEWQHQYPVTARNAGHQLLAAAKFSIFQKPTQPVLIVTSTADRLVDYRCSLDLHRTWQTDYEQHHSAGHDLSLDEPEWLANIAKQWISSI